MTGEERIAELHRRVRERNRMRERYLTNALGTVACALFLSVLVMISEEGTHTGALAGIYSGSTLLFGSAGAYVLTAVVAFMLGVVITALIKHFYKDEEKMEGNER